MKKRRSPMRIFELVMRPKYISPFDQNDLLCQELADHGPMAADVIIGQLNAYWLKHGSLPDVKDSPFYACVFFLCGAIREVAEPRHAQAIAQLTLIPDIGSNTDASALNELLYTLEGLGQHKVILPYLIKLRKIVRPEKDSSIKLIDKMISQAQ